MRKLIYIIIMMLLFLACAETEIKWKAKFDVAGPGNYRIDGIHGFRDIYVTGSFWEPDQNPYCITAAYNKDGELGWHTLYEQQDLKASRGKAILSSHDGIYILVHTTDINDIKKVLLIKYNEFGTLQWERTIEQSTSNITSQMLSDYSGNIYIAGWTSTTKTPITIFIAKYRPSGEMIWFTKYSNPSLHFSNLKFDIITPDQFLVGGILETSKDFFFLKYDSMGQFSGLTQYKTPEHEKSLAAIRGNNKGNVYLAGTSTGKETEDDYLTVAYDNNNNLLWAERFDGPAHQDDRPNAMAVDESTNVYITGSSTDKKGRTEIVTLKYDQNGNELWQKTYKGKKSAQPYILRPVFIRYDENFVRDLYIVGTVDDKALLLRYNTTGGHSWSATYSSGKGKRNIPTAYSGHCLAIKSISEEIHEAFIVKFGKSEPLGIARWD